MNTEIIKTKLFHQIKYVIQGHARSHKALLKI